MAPAYRFRPMYDTDARERFGPERFTLSVATFDERAIGVYGQAGVRRIEVLVHETNGGEHESLRMERGA